MRKCRWLSLVLLSSTFLGGCGMFPRERAKKPIKICVNSNSANVRTMDERIADQNYRSGDDQSLPFTKCENIYAYIEKQRESYLGCEDQGEPKVAIAYEDNNGVNADAGHSPEVMSDRKSAASPDILTHLRERGVDEADLAKVSQDHIFVASAGQIAVLDRKSKQWMGLLKVNDSDPNSSIESGMMSPETSPQLLTKDEQLLVITASRIQTYSLKAKSMPVLKEEVALSQPASEVRLIGSRLILLSHSYSSAISSSRPIQDDQMIRTLPCDSTYPELYSHSSSYGLSTTVVKSLDLNDLKSEKSFAFLQNFNSYITTNNIYLYSQDYSRDTTYIRKISLNENGDLLDVATGSVPGYIKDSWALSESGTRGEFLSVVSTSLTNKSSQLSILTPKESQLTLVGSIRDIGIGEDVKSVRKVDNGVFVGTFREVDPLFAIDISDVTSPKILSSLKIPGFSSYMHPFGSSRLIGLGYSSGNRGFDKSVQMSLFDTTDLTDVKRLDAITIGAPGSSSIATVDYHAFFMDQENSLVGVPVEYSSMISVLSRNRADGTSSPFQNQEATKTSATPSSHLTSGAALYRIGPSSIKALKFIQHEDIAIPTIPSASSAASFCPWYPSPSKILRILKIDNQLVSISANALKSFDLTDDLPLAASASWEIPQSSCSAVYQDY